MRESGYSKSLKSLLKRFPESLRLFLQEAIKNSPFPLIVLDKSLKILAVDLNFCKKTGYDASKLVGENFKTLSPESLSLINKAISRLSRQEKAEIKNITLTGLKNKKLQGSAVINAHRKKNTEIFLIYFPALEAKKARNIINNSNSFDDFIFNLTKTGKWILDPESREFTGSAICYELLGIEANNKTIKFIEVLNLIPSREEKENLERDILKLTQNPRKTEREIRIKSGNTEFPNSRHIQLIFNKLEIDGITYIGGTIIDISEIKRIEKDLLKSRNKIEKADRFKSVFLANLSHEIRTPMNAILGYSELLSQPGLNEKEINNFTSIIKTKGNHLLALIDDVIEISRFESGNIKFNYKEFLLLPLLKELYQEYNQLRKEKRKDNIEIILDVPEDAPEQYIYTDYGRLQQLLSNLLSNALKFTERGQIIFGYKISSKNYKFFVSDTGIGLSEEDRMRVFNRFEIIEETSLSRLSGTGFSLTITRYIVEALGGKIKLKSEIKKGSRFQLNIPILSPPDKKEKPAEEKLKTDSFNWKDKVILIAEDEDVNFRFLEAILQKTDAQILHAKNGIEAVELCKKINQIDIVLMDIKMPVVNGYDATIEIKRYRTNLPIIAQTAFASKDEIKKCIEVGCDDFITKPIDINELITKINYQFTR